MEFAIELPKQVEMRAEQCPKCNNVIPVHPYYVAWCDQCGWNLQPHLPERPQNFIESLYESLGAKLSQRFFDSIAKEPLKPRWTGSRILALALAALVHALTIVTAVAGLILLIKGRSSFIAIVLGICCVIMVWVLRPRLDQWPKKVLPPTEFPTLYGLVGRIAQALGTPSVDGIAVSGDFNAAFGRAGWRQKRVLYLGLPLFHILTDQEKVAVLAHELSHSVNGDPFRGFFIGAAVNALIEWHAVLKPERIWASEEGIRGILMIPFNLFMLAFSYVPYLVGYGLVHLL